MGKTVVKAKRPLKSDEAELEALIRDKLARPELVAPEWAVELGKKLDKVARQQNKQYDLLVDALFEQTREESRERRLKLKKINVKRYVRNTLRGALERLED